MTEASPIDRFYAALGNGDIAAARACFTPDAQVWHAFDGIAHDLAAVIKGWEGLVANSLTREIADIRRHPIDGGLVQQHMFVMTTLAGARMGWAVCLVVRIEGDRIARIEEYIDRAGSLAIADGQVTTPGL